MSIPCIPHTGPPLPVCAVQNQNLPVGLSNAVLLCPALPCSALPCRALTRHVDFELVRVVLVGSPGFLRDDLMHFVAEQAVRRGDTALLKNKAKFVKVAASSGHKNAVDQLLGNVELVFLYTDSCYLFV